MVTQPSPYPHIVRTPGYVGGRPRIDGTRISVDILVGYYRIYEGNIAGLRTAFPHLTPEQIEEALAFYADHRAEIDEYILANDESQ